MPTKIIVSQSTLEDLLHLAETNTEISTLLNYIYTGDDDLHPKD